jgi:hypothetical protein
MHLRSRPGQTGFMNDAEYARLTRTFMMASGLLALLFILPGELPQLDTHK